VTLITPSPDSAASMLYNEETGKMRKLPTVVFLHDGLFVAGSANHSWAADLARAIPCMVVSVEYSLAPENVYHDAVMDAVDAMMWAMGAADHSFTDIDRFGFVGVEAGATIATAAALHVCTLFFRFRIVGVWSTSRNRVTTM
jgi:acetyl esterase